MLQISANVSTLRPGLLVALKTSVTGNVNYFKTDIERTAFRVHWETVRTVEDPAEHEAAGKLRNKVRSLVRSACAASAFGFLCPEDRRDKLNAALAEANALVAAFNAKAKYNRVWFGVMVGKVAATDFEAVRAINSEVRDLLDEMQAGIAGSDAEAVRDAAQRARGIAQMLATEAQQLVDEAVEAARKAARSIVKAKTEGTEEAKAKVVELSTAAVTVLAAKRGSFLDFDVKSTDVAAPVVSRNIELEAASHAL